MTVSQRYVLWSIIGVLVSNEDMTRRQGWRWSPPPVMPRHWFWQCRSKTSAYEKTYSNTQREGADCVKLQKDMWPVHALWRNTLKFYCRRSESGRFGNYSISYMEDYGDDSGLRWRVRLAFGIFFLECACSHNSNRLIGANPIQVGFSDRILEFEHFFIDGSYGGWVLEGLVGSVNKVDSFLLELCILPHWQSLSLEIASRGLIRRRAIVNLEQPGSVLDSSKIFIRSWCWWQVLRKGFLGCWGCREVWIGIG